MIGEPRFRVIVSSAEAERAIVRVEIVAQDAIRCARARPLFGGRRGGRSAPDRDALPIVVNAERRRRRHRGSKRPRLGARHFGGSRRRRDRRAGRERSDRRTERRRVRHRPRRGGRRGNAIHAVRRRSGRLLALDGNPLRREEESRPERPRAHPASLLRGLRLGDARLQRGAVCATSCVSYARTFAAPSSHPGPPDGGSSVEPRARSTYEAWPGRYSSRVRRTSASTVARCR